MANDLFQLLKPYVNDGMLREWPGGVIVFLQDEPPHGIWLVYRGEVKLMRTSQCGKQLVVEMVQPGEITGLSAAIIGISQELSAFTQGACQLGFIDRRTLLAVMVSHPTIAGEIARLLSYELHIAYRCISRTTISRSAKAKVATFLLDPGRARVMSHADMADHLGVSRETVTRILGGLRRRGMISVGQHGNLCVIKPLELERACE